MTAIARPPTRSFMPVLLNPGDQHRVRLPGAFLRGTFPEDGGPVEVLHLITGTHMGGTVIDDEKIFLPYDGFQVRPSSQAGISVFRGLPSEIAGALTVGGGARTYEVYDSFSGGVTILSGLELVPTAEAIPLLQSAKTLVIDTTPEIVPDIVELARMYPFYPTPQGPTLRALTAGELTDLLRAGRLPPQLKESLQTTPPATFTKTWTVLVLSLGEFTSGGHGIEVLGVTKKDDTVTVHCREIQPTPGKAYKAVVNAPAAFVAIPRIDLPAGSRIELNRFDY